MVLLFLLFCMVMFMVLLVVCAPVMAVLVFLLLLPLVMLMLVMCVVAAAVFMVLHDNAIVNISRAARANKANSSEGEAVMETAGRWWRCGWRECGWGRKEENEVEEEARRKGVLRGWERRKM